MLTLFLDGWLGCIGMPADFLEDRERTVAATTESIVSSCCWSLEKRQQGELRGGRLQQTHTDTLLLRLHTFSR